MDWAIKREDLYIEHYSWRFISDGFTYDGRDDHLDQSETYDLS